MDPAVFSAGMSATAKLLSSIGLGSLAAKKSNVLDGNAVSALSRLTYWVFQPAFLLCSVSKTMMTASTGAAGGLPGKYLALMPIMAAIQIAMGTLSGLFICKVGGITSPAEQADVRMCTTFANSGPLPLIFSEALFQGQSPALFSDVAACISFYLLLWSPLFWSFGRIILGTYSSGDSLEKNASLLSKLGQEVTKLLSPPVIGCILGLMIGSIPMLRSAFFGGIATPLFGAMSTLGTAYLPVALLVLAGSLVGGGSNKSKAVNGDPSPPASTVPSIKSMVCIFLSRFLLAPALSFVTLDVLSKTGLLGPIGTRARAVVSFVILAEGCMPPAQNSVVMLQLEGLKERASSMAKLLTILYSVAVIPVTILLSACLAKSNILAFR